MDIVTGFVERITYRNDDTGYSVMTLSTPDEEEVCVVGIFPQVSEGETLSCEGEMVTHPVYGEQLKVRHVEFLPPQDEIAIERFLGSGLLKGVGKALAKRIVKEFGVDAFRVIEEEPERLQEVRGISERIAREISDQMVERREVRSAIIFLQQYGISIHMAMKIYREYESGLYTVIKENPYKLAEDIDGIGFKAADEIAKNMGMRMDSVYRIHSAVSYALTEGTVAGHTYLPRDVLFTETERLLNIQLSDFENILLEMQMDKRIFVVSVEEEKRVYLRNYFYMERDVARKLCDMNVFDSSVTDKDVEKTLKKVESEQELNLDETQREAVKMAARSGVTLITGGPGTGKTTTINALIHYFVKEGFDILLAAPTGRAAKRMTEATGFPASTIHRLLEVSGEPSGHGFHFGKNPESPLEADVVIIDEVSMVDLPLMNALLRAMVSGMRIIFSGDVDQLPSVGPGEVLRDLIQSEIFPVLRLTKIYRQTEDSDIIVNAHKINEGEIVENKPSKDFLFVLRDHPGQVSGATITLLKEKLPKYVQADMNELQVLTPTRKGILGVESLNQILQEALNPPSPQKKEKVFQKTIFREGDKVLQIKNDYQLPWRIEKGSPWERGTGVFNGDVGIIESISDFDAEVRVRFDDDRIVDYSFAILDELELAYAVTIHKSQGSEYPAVVIPLFQVPRLLANRNLLYTGVTRAKKCVVIVGSYDMFCQMIENSTRERRYSGLLYFLREIVKEE